VIAFYKGRAVVTHRVVENRKVSGEFITKGDANAEKDMEPVPYSALIGRHLSRTGS
jgi:signal peptidase